MAEMDKIIRIKAYILLHI